MNFFGSTDTAQSPPPVVDDMVQQKNGYMGDLVQLLGRGDEEIVADGMDSSSLAVTEGEGSQEQSLGRIVATGGLVALSTALIALSASGDLAGIVTNAQSFFADPTSALENVVESVESMGSLGFF